MNNDRFRNTIENIVMHNELLSFNHRYVYDKTIIKRRMKSRKVTVMRLLARKTDCVDLSGRRRRFPEVSLKIVYEPGMGISEF